MRQRESLADHPADRQPDVVHARDRQRRQHLLDIVGERGHRVVAGNRVAAAMPAHVEPQHPEPALQQRRDLLGPAAAVGGERMGDADGRRILRVRGGRRRYGVPAAATAWLPPHLVSDRDGLREAYGKARPRCHGLRQARRARRRAASAERRFAGDVHGLVAALLPADDREVAARHAPFPGSSCSSASLARPSAGGAVTETLRTAAPSARCVIPRAVGPAARRQPDRDAHAVCGRGQRRVNRGGRGQCRRGSSAQKHQDEDQDHRRDVDPAEIRQIGADRAQRRLGHPIQEIADHRDAAVVAVDDAKGEQPAQDSPARSTAKCRSDDQEFR